MLQRTALLSAAFTLLLAAPGVAQSHPNLSGRRADMTTGTVKSVTEIDQRDNEFHFITRYPAMADAAGRQALEARSEKRCIADGRECPEYFKDPNPRGRPMRRFAKWSGDTLVINYGADSTAGAGPRGTYLLSADGKRLETKGPSLIGPTFLTKVP